MCRAVSLLFETHNYLYSYSILKTNDTQGVLQFSVATGLIHNVGLIYTSLICICCCCHCSYCCCCCYCCCSGTYLLLAKQFVIHNLFGKKYKLLVVYSPLCRLLSLILKWHRQRVSWPQVTVNISTTAHRSAANRGSDAEGWLNLSLGDTTHRYFELQI